MNLSDILVKVTAQTAIDQSVITLLNSLVQQLNEAIANGSDPVVIQAIADQLDVNTADIQAAIKANTNSV